MNKKQAHISFFLVFDIPCLLGFFFFYNEVRHIFLDIHNQANMVTVGSKDGFFIFAIAVPLIHSVTIVEYFWFELIKKNEQLVNYSLIVMVILFFISAITISIMIKAKVENAGYANCSELEWWGTYSKSYTYTRNQEICGQLVAEKAKEKQERR